MILIGAGEKAFCAGGDVRTIVETVDDEDPLGEHFFREEYQLNCLIGTLHIPYIALIDGKFFLFIKVLLHMVFSNFVFIIILIN